MDQIFLKDVLSGLSKPSKTLSSKYFYDDVGSKIFQEIMLMPEYYLTNCEFEIFATQAEAIAKALAFNKPFRLIELGAGDGSKTFQLIKGLQKLNLRVEYIALDVSQGALNSLERKLLEQNLNVPYQLICGDYFKVLNDLPKNKPALFLFLGANIGNYENQQAAELLTSFGNVMQNGDKLLVGFDLKKNPLIVQQAYGDPHGITKRFNLNLLARINRELNADFKLDQFDFYCNYNPINGEVRSCLVSLKQQVVSINGNNFEFNRFELIHTELSKKYSLNQIEELAALAGFKSQKNFLDCQHYFTDSLWEKK